MGPGSVPKYCVSSRARSGVRKLSSRSRAGIAAPHRRGQDLPRSRHALESSSGWRHATHRHRARRTAPERRHRPAAEQRRSPQAACGSLRHQRTARRRQLTDGQSHTRQSPRRQPVALISRSGFDPRSPLQPAFARQVTAPALPRSHYLHGFAASELNKVETLVWKHESELLEE